jgi:hypothetical protein
MLKSHLNKKQIGDKHYFEPHLKEINSKRIVKTSRYTTNGESLILVKDIDECRIILDDTTTEHIIIKTLTKVYITPSRNKIDETYDEIFIDRGACVEFYLLEDNWYIVSSDGLKLE